MAVTLQVFAAADNRCDMTPDPTPAQQIDSSQILRAGSSLGVLGEFAQSGRKLFAVLCDPSVTARDIAAVANLEPSIYVRILRVANSGYYCQTRLITTIERAVVLLGLDAVRGIAAAVCLDRTLVRAKGSSPVDMKILVRHSLATAAAAESLASRQRRALTGDAFIAGLLHNLGIVVQLQLDPSGIRAMLEARAAHPLADIRALESQHAIMGHEVYAAQLFEAWQLPASIVAAAEHHHDPLSAPTECRDITSLVSLGANMALACGNTFALEPFPGEPDPAAMTQLGLSVEQLAEIRAELPARLVALRTAVLGK
jgi:HD-like signal output (HDOD) protein